MRIRELIETLERLEKAHGEVDVKHFEDGPEAPITSVLPVWEKGRMIYVLIS